MSARRARSVAMQRLLSGVVLSVAVATAVWFLESRTLLGIAALVMLFAVLEYKDLVERGFQIRLSRVFTGLTAVSAFLSVATQSLAATAEVVLMAGVIAIGTEILLSGRAGIDALHDTAASLFPALYIALPLGALVATHRIGGRESVMLLLLTVVVSDTAQYYTGRLLGRRPLAPAVSPKKTIEGALGGILFGTATVLVGGRWWLPAASIPTRVALGLGLVLAGIVGDLFESLIKRGAGVKDASTLIPGHGGVLDRIDALLFAAPVYYMFVKYVS